MMIHMRQGARLIIAGALVLAAAPTLAYAQSDGAKESATQINQAIAKIDHHKIEIMPNAGSEMSACRLPLIAKITGRSSNLQTISIKCPNKMGGASNWTIYVDAVIQGKHRSSNSQAKTQTTSPAIFVRNGEHVTAIVQNSGISITTRAIALQSGGERQVIEAENEQSHVRFQAQIVNRLPQHNGVYVLK